MDTYYRTDAFIGGRVYCNSKPMSVIANMKPNDRFNNDNRIPIAGKGMVNFGFDRHFRYGGNQINEVDTQTHSILDNNAITGYRNFRSNGSGYCEQ